jgi:hypothetical protein
MFTKSKTICQRRKVMPKKSSYHRCVLTAILALAGILTVATIASADTLDYGGGAGFNGGEGGVPQFDPSLGSLQSVTLTAGPVYLGGSYAFQNMTPDEGGTVYVTMNAFWGVSANYGSLSVGGGGTLSGSGIVAPYGGVPNDNGADTCFIWFNGEVGGVETTTISTGLSNFIGSDWVTLGGYAGWMPGSVVTDPTGLIVGPASGPNFPGGGVTFTLTYTYAPAPEPGTLTLLVSALLGLGAFRMRRRRAKD